MSTKRPKPSLESLMALGQKTLNAPGAEAHAASPAAGPVAAPAVMTPAARAAPVAPGGVSAPPVAVAIAEAPLPAPQAAQVPQSPQEPTQAPRAPVQAPPPAFQAPIPVPVPSTAPVAASGSPSGAPGEATGPGSAPAGVGSFLAQAAESRKARDAQQEAVETATCVFSVPMKREIQAVADEAGMSVAKWVMDAFEWCSANGITASQVADAAAWVADERNRKVQGEDGLAPNRAKGSGVPIRASIYRKVVETAKGVRPRLSNASVLEGCAVIRLHSLRNA
jgi:hypothetical protein